MRTIVVSLSMVCLVLFACGGTDGGGGEPNVTPAAGGTVVSDDGLVTLVIPPGAVSEAVEITITSVALADAPADVTSDPDIMTYYDLQPSGLRFAVAARLTAELTAAEVSALDLAAEDFDQRVLLSRDEAGAVEILAEQEMFIDETDRVTLSADLMHFSGVFNTTAWFRWKAVPESVDTEAPAQWFSSMYVNTRTLGGRSQLIAALELLQGSFSGGDELLNPAPWIAHSESYFGDGVVLDHEVTTRVLERVRDPQDGGMIFGGDHRCDVAGNGRYAVFMDATVRPYGITDGRHFTIRLGRAFPAVCRESVDTIAEGVFNTVVQGAEGVGEIAAKMFSLPTGLSFAGERYIAIAGSNGWAVHRLSDGQVVHDNTSPGYRLYGAVGANNSVVSIGPDGYGDARYITDMMRFGFAQLGLLGDNITDVVPIARDPDSVHGLLLANNTLDTVERLDPDAGNQYGGFVLATTVLSSELGAVPGNLVSVYSPPGEGPFLGLSDSPSFGLPGTLFWVDPQNTAGLTIVGEVGEGPRRIRCLEPAGTPCVVSNYTSGSVMVVDWPDRTQAPSIRATSIAVDGPVGIGIALVNGVPTAVATGFNDDTVHVISIPASGEATDQSVALTSCANPGHATFVNGGSHLVITCNGGTTYEVRALPLP